MAVPAWTQRGAARAMTVNQRGIRRRKLTTLRGSHDLRTE
jgi:hypothetical protein